jgi:hypothetical protein
MKSGKGSTKNKAATNGGSKVKGKRRRVVNTQSTAPQSANIKNNKPGRNLDKRNGNHDSNSNNDDVRINRTHNANEGDRNHKGQFRESIDEELSNGTSSFASTSHTSYNNTSRRARGQEEDKDSWRMNGNQSQGHLLRDYESWLGEPKMSPFESKQIMSFGLDLNDKNKKLSESFKSPFYTYYDEWKWDSLASMNLSKVFAEHDETLLYIFYTMTNDEVQYRSAQELWRKGWLYDESSQTWSATRKGSSTMKNRNEKAKISRGNGKSNDNVELIRYKFDIDQWKIEECRQSENQSQQRFEDLNPYESE